MIPPTISRSGSPHVLDVLDVLDGARWHNSRSLVLPDNITVMPLPPYRPEFNPVETNRQLLRQNHLAHRVFGSYDDIDDVFCAAWNSFIASARLASPQLPRANGRGSEDNALGITKPSARFGQGNRSPSPRPGRMCEGPRLRPVPAPCQVALNLTVEINGAMRGSGRVADVSRA